MPRLALAGHLHYVLQPALAGVPLMRDDDDRRALAAALREAAAGAGVAVHAARLAADALHLLATPAADEALGLAMQALGRRYVAAYNRRHARHGTLWQGRFRAAVLQAGWALPAQVLIETPPPGALEPAGWTSADHHLGRQREPWLVDHAAYWALGNTPFEREGAYRRLRDDGVAPAAAQRMLEAASRGWVVGDAAFVAALAQITARPLVPRPRGRPRRQAPA